MRCSHGCYTPHISPILTALPCFTLLTKPFAHSILLITIYHNTNYSEYKLAMKMNSHTWRSTPKLELFGNVKGMSATSQAEPALAYPTIGVAARQVTFKIDDHSVLGSPYGQVSFSLATSKRLARIHFRPSLNPAYLGLEKAVPCKKNRAYNVAGSCPPWPNISHTPYDLLELPLG